MAGEPSSSAGTPDPSADDYSLAAFLVRAAGDLAASMRQTGVVSERKTSVSDIVTSADRAAEQLIVSRLSGDRPDDGIIGEEGATVAGRRTWYIDPIDGTYNYASGLPVWCSALALRDEDLVLGAVYVPASSELWVGGQDRPTTLNGAPVTALTDRPLAEISVASYMHPTTLTDDSLREPLLRMIRPAATVRMLGSGSVELAAVASGRLGAYVQADCLDWDWLPGQALVEAAGGETAVISSGGHHWHIASNPRAVAEIVALLNTT